MLFRALLRNNSLCRYFVKFQHNGTFSLHRPINPRGTLYGVVVLRRLRNLASSRDFHESLRFSTSRGRASSRLDRDPNVKGAVNSGDHPKIFRVLRRVSNDHSHVRVRGVFQASRDYHVNYSLLFFFGVRLGFLNCNELVNVSDVFRYRHATGGPNRLPHLMGHHSISTSHEFQYVRSVFRFYCHGAIFFSRGTRCSLMSLLHRRSFSSFGGSVPVSQAKVPSIRSF